MLHTSAPAERDTKHQDQIHRVCTSSSHIYYLYAEKSNGIRVGVGDVVSVAVRHANEENEHSLSFCQVASIWKVINGNENNFIIAGRWLDPLTKIMLHLTKTRCRYAISNILAFANVITDCTEN
jgi:hypothetical protein